MALVTGQALRVRRDIPHEPGEWVDIRPLSWKRLDEAKRARQLALAAMVREVGGDVYKAMQELGRTRATAPPASEAPAPEAVRSNGHAAIEPLDPDDYDRGIVLRAGLLGWSYGEKVRPSDYDDLDEATAAWLAGEILALHDRSEEARKND